MKQRHHIFRRESGVYYSLDTLTKKRHSPETAKLDEARRLINAENEAAGNQVRLQLFVLTYNLGNFLRQTVLPRAVCHWTLTTFRRNSSKSGRRSCAIPTR